MNVTLEAIEELQTIRDITRWGASQFRRAGLFFGHGTDNELDEASWLVLHALSLPLDFPEQYRDCRLTRSERTAAIQLLQQRVESRKPAAYLTGEAWFCGLPFVVSESVLVPRSPIGELIQSQFSPWLDDINVEAVLDLCTGNGCIGIACAYAFGDARVVISDISPAALKIANQNIGDHGLGDRVKAIESDLFSNIPQQKFDLIVSNPPYVDAQDMAALEKEFLHEPRLGLEAGDDGLDIAHRILAEAGEYLTDDGILVVEVGNSEAALAAAYRELPLTWLEFEHGGHGVFLLRKSDL